MKYVVTWTYKRVNNLIPEYEILTKVFQTDRPDNLEGMMANDRENILFLKEGYRPHQKSVINLKDFDIQTNTEYIGTTKIKDIVKAYGSFYWNEDGSKVIFVPNINPEAPYPGQRCMYMDAEDIKAIHNTKPSPLMPFKNLNPATGEPFIKKP